MTRLTNQEIRDYVEDLRQVEKAASTMWFVLHRARKHIDGRQEDRDILKDIDEAIAKYDRARGRTP